MRKQFVILLVLAFCLAMASENCTYESLASHFEISGKADVVDGTVKLSSNGQLNVKFEEQRSLAKSIRFRYRVLDTRSTPSTPTLIVSIGDDEDVTACLRFRVDSIIEAHYSKKGAPRGGFVARFSAESPEWHSVQLDFYPSLLTIAVDGHEVGHNISILLSCLFVRWNSGYSA